MEVFLVNKSGTVHAKGRYDESNGTITVLKGSIISKNVSGGTFRSADTVKKLRSNPEQVVGTKVISDMVFKSASTAANFVTGSSTNGLLSWKNKDGVSLKQLIAKTE